MNRRGQALVEFVLILPIFIFLVFVAVDFGIIVNEKNKLENNSLDIINLYNKGIDTTEIENVYNINVVIDNSNTDYYVIEINKKVKLRTIGLGKILGNPYKISVERVVPYAE